MAELKCPNCNTVIEVLSYKSRTFCPKCLREHNKQFVMLETTTDPYTNLGDGLFTRKDK